MRPLFCLNNDIWSYFVYQRLRKTYPDHDILLTQSKISINSELSHLENFLGGRMTPDWHPLGFVDKINTPYYKKLALNYDLIISVRFLKIFDAEFCRIPPLGIVNLHSGPLPSYRGLMATFWEMLNTEKQHGFCIHYIEDHKIDCGGIIQNILLPVLDKASPSMAYILYHKYHMASEILLNILHSIEKTGRMNTLSQGQGHYYSKPTPQDIKQFHLKGLQFSISEDLDFIQQQIFSSEDPHENLVKSF